MTSIIVSTDKDVDELEFAIFVRDAVAVKYGNAEIKSIGMECECSICVAIKGKVMQAKKLVEEFKK